MSDIGVFVLVAALALTAAGAWWLRARNGAVRPEEGDNVPASGVFERLGVRPADADLTVVQFSTAFCGPCRATKARLQHLQATRSGLAVVHPDELTSLVDAQVGARVDDPR